MPGLGFRPLRYQDGTGPEGVEKPGMTHENALLYIKWLHGEGSGSLPPDEQMSLNNLAEAFEIWQRNPEAAIAYATRLQALIGAAPGVQKNITARAAPLLPPGTGDYEMREDPNIATTSAIADAYYGGGIPGPSFVPTGDQTAPDFREIAPTPLLPPGTGYYEMREDPNIDTTSAVADAYYGGGIPGPSFVPTGDQTAPDFQGYAGGGMMSKRHRDQDWYRRMGRMRGGLGSLGPRRRRA